MNKLRFRIAVKKILEKYLPKYNYRIKIENTVWDNPPKLYVEIIKDNCVKLKGSFPLKMNGDIIVNPELVLNEVEMALKGKEC